VLGLRRRRIATRLSYSSASDSPGFGDLVEQSVSHRRIVDILAVHRNGDDLAAGGPGVCCDRSLTCSKIDIAIPDHTTLSRRGNGLTILPKRIHRTEPLHLLVDSTGLKIYGEGEWLGQKHGIRSRRRWRKLHVDADTHEIVAVEAQASLRRVQGVRDMTTCSVSP
jgi:Transposase DDE domain